MLAPDADGRSLKRGQDRQVNAPHEHTLACQSGSEAQPLMGTVQLRGWEFLDLMFDFEVEALQLRVT